MKFKEYDIPKDVLKSLNKIDPSIYWNHYKLTVVDTEPYGVESIGDSLEIHWPKNPKHIDDFLINFYNSQTLFCIPNEEDIDVIKHRIKEEPVAVDIESTGLNPYLITSEVISFSLSFNDLSFSFPVSPNIISKEDSEKYTELMLHIILNAKYLILQNGGFDIGFLSHFYPDKVHINPSNFKFDTLIAAHIATGEGLKEYNLDYLARKFCKAPTWKGGPREWLEENFSRTKDRTYDKIPMYILLPYGRKDSYYTYKVYEKLKAKIDSSPDLTKIYDIVHFKINNVCNRMQRDGLWINKFAIDFLFDAYDKKSKNAEINARKVLKTRIDTRIKDSDIEVSDEVKPNLYKYVDEIDFKSSAQLGALLFNFFKLPVLKRTEKKAEPKVGVNELITLAPFDPPLFASLLTYKKWANYKSYLKSYIKLSCQLHGLNKLDKQVVCHSNFKSTGTVTGRLSSSKPNGQNVSVGSGLKNCFVPPDLSLLIDDIYLELFPDIEEEVENENVESGFDWEDDEIKELHK